MSRITYYFVGQSLRDDVENLRGQIQGHYDNEPSMINGAAVAKMLTKILDREAARSGEETT